MKHMMGNTGIISFCPLSLFLWGKACPYLHNGAQRVEDGKGGVINIKSTITIVDYLLI